jgi:hypothetical protein
MYFATTTARDAALTGSILVDGMVSYTPATGLVVYNGSTWAAPTASIPSSYGFTAGKNAIINGDFGIWQRGTSFSNPSLSYTSDRWQTYADGTGGTWAVSQQTFTPGTAPVAGYEGTYYSRWARSVNGTGNTANVFFTKLEDVRLYAGQTVTLSFWAKADSARSISAWMEQWFGTGGSSSVVNIGSTSFSITTSWARYSATITMPSISGKTIGTSSYISPVISFPSNTTFTIDLWGVQLEAGSTATSFQTATGTKQGELAACQRYYWRTNGTASTIYAVGAAFNTTSVDIVVPLPVTMRVTPTSWDFANLRVYQGSTAYSSGTFAGGNNGSSLDRGYFSYVHGSAVFTAGYAIELYGSAAGSYIGFNSEL